jgi:hypothetical protein
MRGSPCQEAPHGQEAPHASMLTRPGTSDHEEPPARCRWHTETGAHPRGRPRRRAHRRVQLLPDLAIEVGRQQLEDAGPGKRAHRRRDRHRRCSHLASHATVFSRRRVPATLPPAPPWKRLARDTCLMLRPCMMPRPVLDTQSAPIKTRQRQDSRHLMRTSPLRALSPSAADSGPSGTGHSPDSSLLGPALASAPGGRSRDAHLCVWAAERAADKVHHRLHLEASPAWPPRQADLRHQLQQQLQPPQDGPPRRLRGTRTAPRVTLPPQGPPANSPAHATCAGSSLPARKAETNSPFSRVWHTPG